MSLDPGLYDGRYLIPGEDPEEFLAVVEDYRRRYAGGFETEFFVATLIHGAWSLRRYRKAEREIIETVRKGSRALLPPEVNDRAFQNLQKIVGMIQARYDRNLRLVLKLQKDSQPKPRKATSGKIGFVRQNKIDEQPGGPFLVTPPPPKTKPN